MVLKMGVATLILRDCEVKIHIPEMGAWESTRILEPLENDCKNQNTLHKGVLYIIGKLLKCTCLKWAHMTHLDICSISYGKKKGQKFDFRSQTVKN